MFCLIPHDESETSPHLPTENMIWISNLKLKNLFPLKLTFSLLIHNYFKNENKTLSIIRTPSSVQSCLIHYSKKKERNRLEMFPFLLTRDNLLSFPIWLYNTSMWGDPGNYWLIRGLPGRPSQDLEPRTPKCQSWLLEPTTLLFALLDAKAKGHIGSVPESKR